MTIEAPPEAVWPWLAQLGQDRAGFYSYEWLENLAGCDMHNADEIHPEWQEREPGDTVYLHPLNGLPVARFEPGRVLALEDWGAFVLEPHGPGAQQADREGPDAARDRRAREHIADGDPALRDGAQDAARHQGARRADAYRRAASRDAVRARRGGGACLRCSSSATPWFAPTRAGEQVRRSPARDDVTGFRAALAVVALAVADDAFIHPEPGVAAGDHLVSGFVPLAVAAVLIGIAPRLCALVRGWLAIFAGALAITGGVADGVRHIAIDRISGDDVTAVLAGVAGIILVALGVATLWRTRRTTG